MNVFRLWSRTYTVGSDQQPIIGRVFFFYCVRPEGRAQSKRRSLVPFPLALASVARCPTWGKIPSDILAFKFSRVIVIVRGEELRRR